MIAGAVDPYEAVALVIDHHKGYQVIGREHVMAKLQPSSLATLSPCPKAHLQPKQTVIECAVANST
jgi:hypothetical protein